MAQPLLADRIIVMNPIAKLWWTAKAVGWDNLPRRVLQAFRVRSGLLRTRLAPELFSQESFESACLADPAQQTELWANRANRFFAIPDGECLRRVADDGLWAQHVTDVCKNALDGQYQFFSRWLGQLGWPPDFNLDPTNDLHWETGCHWLDGPNSLGAKADIKLVWEASRFSLAYHFARAYVRDKDEKWAHAFWEMFDTWIERNHPQLTANWRCGQEMTFRLMGTLFGAFATLGSNAASPVRLTALTKLAWRTGLHLEANINYARSQKNNHAISEATGLWTIGLLFDELDAAESWCRQGRKILAAEAKRQIYQDGSFVQHSMSCHRVMMDDVMWAIQLGRINNEPLGDIVTERFACATAWLTQMLDPESGRAPNYGSNDGANVLPLACGDYLDYRPTVQAASVMTENCPCLRPGPWDEKALCLFGREQLESPVRPIVRKPEFAAPDGRYYILRGPDSWAMTRCCTYRHRPGQADMLHVDLWYKGVNVLRDAGSYMYSCPEPWKHYFHSTAAHNTVEIDGKGQMTKGPRFLWFHWTKSEIQRFTAEGDQGGVLKARHYGYRRLPGPVVHERVICRTGDVYAIEDTLTSSGCQTHQAVMRWRLCQGDWSPGRGGREWRADISGDDFSIRIACSGDFECRMISDQEEEGIEGSESLYYGLKPQLPTVLSTVQVNREVKFMTLLGPVEQMTDEMLMEAYKQYAPQADSETVQ